MSLAPLAILATYGLAAVPPAGAGDAPAPAGQACAAGYHAQPWSEPRVGSAAGLDAALASAGGDRVLYVGETHARAEHQALHLEMVCRLHEAGADVVVAVEFLQRPFQAYVDDFLSGRLDETALRRASDYDRRWGYPYELYAPVLRFARDAGIPVIALNVPSELTRKIAMRGYGALSDAERAYLPADLTAMPRGYGDRLLGSYRNAAAHHGMAFRRFELAQLAWDEGMAEGVAAALESDPEATVVVLAGNGHVAWRGGIPERVHRRTGLRGSVWVNHDGGDVPRYESADRLVRWPAAGAAAP